MSFPGATHHWIIFQQLRQVRIQKSSPRTTLQPSSIRLHQGQIEGGLLQGLDFFSDGACDGRRWQNYRGQSAWGLQDVQQRRRLPTAFFDATGIQITETPITAERSIRLRDTETVVTKPPMCCVRFRQRSTHLSVFIIRMFVEFSVRAFSVDH